MPGKTDAVSLVRAIVLSGEVKEFTYKKGKKAGQVGHFLKVDFGLRRMGRNWDSGEPEVKQTKIKYTFWDGDNARVHQEFERAAALCVEGRYVEFEAHLQMRQVPNQQTGEMMSWLEASNLALNFEFDGIEESAPETDPKVPTFGFVKSYELRGVKRSDDDGGDEIVDVLDLTFVHRFAERNSRGGYDFIGVEYTTSFWPGENPDDDINPSVIFDTLQALPNEGKGATICVLGYPRVKKDTYNDTVGLTINDPAVDLTYGEVGKQYATSQRVPQLVGAVADDDDGW